DAVRDLLPPPSRALTAIGMTAGTGTPCPEVVRCAAAPGCNIRPATPLRLQSAHGFPYRRAAPAAAVANPLAHLAGHRPDGAGRTPALAVAARDRARPGDVAAHAAARPPRSGRAQPAVVLPGTRRRGARGAAARALPRAGHGPVRIRTRLVGFGRSDAPRPGGGRAGTHAGRARRWPRRDRGVRPLQHAGDLRPADV